MDECPAVWPSVLCFYCVLDEDEDEDEDYECVWVINVTRDERMKNVVLSPVDWRLVPFIFRQRGPFFLLCPHPHVTRTLSRPPIFPFIHRTLISFNHTPSFAQNKAKCSPSTHRRAKARPGSHSSTIAVCARVQDHLHLHRMPTTLLRVKEKPRTKARLSRKPPWILIAKTRERTRPQHQPHPRLGPHPRRTWFHCPLGHLRLRRSNRDRSHPLLKLRSTPQVTARMPMALSLCLACTFAIAATKYVVQSVSRTRLSAITAPIACSMCPPPVSSLRSTSKHE